MLEQQFGKLGFNDKEIRAFLTLAEVGKATASVIGKRSDIPRSTVYSVLDGLIERGVVSIEHVSGTTFYVANDSTSFERMVEKEEEQIQEKKNAVRDLVEMIEPYLKSAHHSTPKLQYFEGKRNVENMLFRYLPVWRKTFAPAKDFTTWGFVDHTFHVEYRRWALHRLSLQEAGGEETIKCFSNRPVVDEQIKRKVPGREIRLFPESMTITCSVFVYGEYMIMLLTRDKPHCAFQLHNPVFAENLRAVFKLLWKLTG